MRAQQGGIEVLAAETLFASGTRVSLSHIYNHKGTLFSGGTEVANPLNRSVDEQWLVTGIDYGLRANVTLSALVPLVSKSLSSDAGDATGQGLGDVALVAKYRAYKRDWYRSTSTSPPSVAWRLRRARRTRPRVASRYRPDSNRGSAAGTRSSGCRRT